MTAGGSNKDTHKSAEMADEPPCPKCGCEESGCHEIGCLSEDWKDFIDETEGGE